MQILLNWKHLECACKRISEAYRPHQIKFMNIQYLALHKYKLWIAKLNAMWGITCVGGLRIIAFPVISAGAILETAKLTG